MKEILLTRNQVALVDDDDFERLSQYKWHALPRGQNAKYGYYAARKINISGKQTTLFMHRAILGLHGTEQCCDHIDRNGLNNQKINLRVATSSENAMNRTIRCDSTSGLKGVVSAKNKWRAHIKVNKKPIHLGYYATPREAAMAYDQAAIKYHGEFAVLNSQISIN